jgi:hypothetical protein
MQTRARDRLKALEEKLSPKAVVLVFLGFEGPDRPSRADQIAAFRAENGLTPSDPIHEVWMTFC